MKNLVSKISFIGPGIIFAAVSIGASHIVLSPRAGMIFGYELLWVVAVGHFFKYFGFEFGPRYAVSAGESLISGYARIGKRKVALWVFLAGTFLQGLGVGVAVTSITASVLEVSIGGLGVGWWGVVVVSAACLFIFFGGYRWLEVLNKVMMCFLFLITVATFMASPIPAGKLYKLVVPSLPPGSIVLLSAMLGWLPTGIDVSVWHSLWIFEHGYRVGEKVKTEVEREKRIYLSKTLFDMRVGYLLSFLLGIMFYTLGTKVEISGGTAPDGADVALTIISAYGKILGDWIVGFLLLAIFFGMFSTTYVVVDGFPRAFSASLAELFSAKLKSGGYVQRWKRKVYKASVVFLWAGISLLIIFVPKPVFLTTSAAVLSFIIAPFLYYFNYYCMTRFVKQDSFKIALWQNVLSLAGVVFMLVSSILFIVFCIFEIKT